MRLLDRYMQLIAWYQKKLGLTDFGLLWLVFFKGVFATPSTRKIDFSLDV